MKEEFLKALNRHSVAILKEEVQEMTEGVLTNTEVLGVHGTIRWGVVNSRLSQLIIDIQEDYYAKLNNHAQKTQHSLQGCSGQTDQGLYLGQIGYNKTQTKEEEEQCIT